MGVKNSLDVYHQMMKKVRFIDPLYGLVECSSFEAELLFTPEVQRLRYIRMCNINSLFISGASEISRYEHTVGVLALAKFWTSINRVSPRNSKIIRAAAILHDMQTGPFGHSLEYIIDDNQVETSFSHEDIDKGFNNQFFQNTSANISFQGARFRANDQLGDIWPEVSDAIQGKGQFGSLISAAIDIDNIDNVLRLAFHVGLIERKDAAMLCRELVADTKYSGGQLSFTTIGVDKIVEWQNIRKKLYLLLLHDWAEFSAKAMLSKIMEDAFQADLIGPDTWLLTDDGLIEHLRREAVGEKQHIGEVLKRLVWGNLYSPIAIYRISGTKHYDKLSQIEFKRGMEEKFSRVVGGKCIFHSIKDRNKTMREISVFNRETDCSITVGHSTDETLIGVFSSKDKITERQISQINNIICTDIGLDFCELEILPDPTVEFETTDLETDQFGLFDGFENIKTA